VAEKILVRSKNRRRRDYVLSILLLMVLINIAVRYPVEHPMPHGSDTFFTLDLAKALTEDGSAGWVLSPMSYFGLYPLSYPGGTPFLYAELKLLSDFNWNAMPIVFNIIFPVLLVLAGFILFRSFRIRDDLAAILAGLMALSPLFLFLTFEQATSRGLVVPIFVLGFFTLFWQNQNMKARVLMFTLFTFTAFAVHRSSFMVIVLEIVAGSVIWLVPYLPHINKNIRPVAFAACAALGLCLVFWPFIPALDRVISDIPQMSFSYFMAELEFRTGFFLSGDTPFVIFANLSTNYVGSVGLLLLLLPMGFMAIYPSSKESRERDIFLIVTMLIFAPVAWKTQYIQLIMLPFFYLLVGLAISRVDRVLLPGLRMILREWRKAPKTAHPRFRLPRAFKSGMVVGFLVLCLIFSLVMFDHRSSFSEPGTDIMTWLSNEEISLGSYIGNYESNDKDVFVSPLGTLDRRIRWFSGWDSPTADPAVLVAHGYLSATAKDFHLVAQHSDYVDFLSSFYEFGNYYLLNTSVENHTLYQLSWYDIFGFFKLYFQDENCSYMNPHISTNQAGIELVVEISYIPGRAPNAYAGQGTIPNKFLQEMGTLSYSIYENTDYRVYLAAMPEW